MDKRAEIDMENNSVEVYGGIFKSLQDAEDFMQITDGIPLRFYQELYLQGDSKGRIEIKFFEKMTNKAEELYRDFPYGDVIVEGLQARFLSKLKRRVNTAIVIYDFYLPKHFTGHPMSVMKEKRTDDFYIFDIDSIFPYQDRG